MVLQEGGSLSDRARGQAGAGGAAALLALLLAACQRPSPTPEPDGPFPGVSDPCPQVACVARPSPAPSAPAPEFADCEATIDQQAARPGPHPLTAKVTRERRGRGDATLCCYDVPRLCGGGRALVVAGDARTARLVTGGWG
jgi:hypothetical protein